MTQACFFCDADADGQVVRWTGQDHYSKFCCKDCADKRNFELQHRTDQ